MFQGVTDTSRANNAHIFYGRTVLLHLYACHPYWHTAHCLAQFAVIVVFVSVVWDSKLGLGLGLGSFSCSDGQGWR